MDETKGTPKTIDEAISNAYHEWVMRNLDSNTKVLSRLDEINIMKTHIRDFVAQKAFHKDETTAQHYRELYYKIFGLKEGS